MNPRYEYLFGILFAVFLFIAGMSAAGCVSAVDAARTTVNAAGVALDETDRSTAVHYSLAAHRALQAALDLEDYQERMEPWNAVEEALGTARTVLVRAEEAVNLWEEGGAIRWSAILVEALDAFGEIVHRLEAVGVDPPPSLREVVQVTEAYVATYRGSL